MSKINKNSLSSSASSESSNSLDFSLNFGDSALFSSLSALSPNTNTDAMPEDTDALHFVKKAITDTKKKYNDYTTFDKIKNSILTKYPQIPSQRLDKEIINANGNKDVKFIAYKHEKIGKKHEVILTQSKTNPNIYYFNSGTATCVYNDKTKDLIYKNGTISDTLDLPTNIRNTVESINFINCKAPVYAEELLTCLNSVISISLNGLDTSNTVNVAEMFMNNPYLTVLDISNLDTTKAETQFNMLHNDKRLKVLKIGKNTTLQKDDRPFNDVICYSFNSNEFTNIFGKNNDGYGYYLITSKKELTDKIIGNSFYKSGKKELHSKHDLPNAIFNFIKNYRIPCNGFGNIINPKLVKILKDMKYKIKVYNYLKLSFYNTDLKLKYIKRWLRLNNLSFNRKNINQWYYSNSHKKFIHDYNIYNISPEKAYKLCKKYNIDTSSIYTNLGKKGAKFLTYAHNNHININDLKDYKDDREHQYFIKKKLIDDVCTATDLLKKETIGKIRLNELMKKSNDKYLANKLTILFFYFHTNIVESKLFKMFPIPMILTRDKKSVNKGKTMRTLRYNKKLIELYNKVYDEHHYVGDTGFNDRDIFDIANDFKRGYMP